MHQPFNINDYYGLNHVTFTIVDLVDVFTGKQYRDLLTQGLNFYTENRGLRVYEYVIMNNHMQAILKQPAGHLSHTIRDLKKYTAQNIIRLVKEEPENRRDWILHRFQWNGIRKANVEDYQVWIHGSHAVDISNRKLYEQKRERIRMDPVMNGLVALPEHWLYSSASDITSASPLVKLFLPS